MLLRNEHAMLRYDTLERYLPIKKDPNSIIDTVDANEEYGTQLNVLKEDLKDRFPEPIGEETPMKLK